MLNRNYVIRRMLVYKFGSSDFVTKESKVEGKKKERWKWQQKFYIYFPNPLSQLYLYSLLYNNGSQFPLDYLYKLI
jgi:hypothetical protein